jgi:hypothetical protein
MLSAHPQLKVPSIVQDKFMKTAEDRLDGS